MAYAPPSEVVYGCSREVVLALNGGQKTYLAGSKAFAFKCQRQNAKHRGVAWEITFPEWVAVWDASGKWAERGRKRGQYVMARYGDVGPYRVGNVEIQQTNENVKDWNDRGGAMRITLAMIGKGRGWYYHAGPKTPQGRPYRANFRGMTLGHYATPDEARAVYIAAVSNFRAQQSTQSAQSGV
jgi:hypothetical protein